MYGNVRNALINIRFIFSRNVQTFCFYMYVRLGYAQVINRQIFKNSFISRTNFFLVSCYMNIVDPKPTF